jgi:hypothetical protein
MDMNTTVILGKTMEGCPQPWRNFFDVELVNLLRDTRDDVVEELINQRLVVYGGVLAIDDERNAMIEFDSAQSKLVWMLKWS